MTRPPTWRRTVPPALLAAVLLASGLSASAAAGRPADGVETSLHAATATIPPGHRTLSAKKGVSLWKFGGVRKSLRSSGSSWFWNWDSSPRDVHVPAGVEFVPMLWGSGSVTPTRLAEAEASGTELLGFNEPDHTDQSNMTVQQALDLWPQLEATGLRLGSPAVAENAATPGGWLDRFMSGAAAQNLRVDFVAAHWYGSDFDPTRATQQLRDYLTAIHDRYGKPVWLTEYALISWSDGAPHYPTPREQAAFIAQSTTMLESLPWLERYAWFSLPASTTWRATGLYRPGARPTIAGSAYAAAGPTS